MIVLQILVGYAFVGALIGGTIYGIMKGLHKNNPDDPAIFGAILWPFAIFVLIGLGVGSIVTYLVKEFNNPKENI